MKIVRLLTGILLLIFLTICLGAKIYSQLVPPGTPKGSYSGFELFWDGTGEPRVTRVNPRGPAADVLQVGDEVIAIDGVKISDDPRILFINVSPGTIQTLTRRRGGDSRDVVIQTIPHDPATKSKNRRYDPHQIVGIPFLLAGWIIFLLRWDDKQAWLLSMMFVTLTGLIGGDAVNLPEWLMNIVGFSGVLGLLFLPAFVHFFMIFPEKSPLLDRLPRLETWLYLPFVLLFIPIFTAQEFLLLFPQWLTQFRWITNLYGYLIRLGIILSADQLSGS
ncbi:MAG: PDZ domain-containing protein [Acidobacteria bacterium]|nr:PDZ domain-containing protein [Acidobacteriota bacterium]